MAKTATDKAEANRKRRRMLLRMVLGALNLYADSRSWSEKDAPRVQVIRSTINLMLAD